MVKRYLLDTNVYVEWLRDWIHVVKQLRSVGMDSCAISEITVAELYYGVAKAAHPYQERHRQALEALIESIAVLPVWPGLLLFGEEKARLRRAGTLVEDFDLLIGCTALAHGLTLVTGNRRHFERMQGLKVETWAVV